jgi:hypothetical protein
MRIVLIAVLLAFVTLDTQARELIEMSFDLPTETSGAEAKQQAFDQATEKATLQLTEDLLGADKAARYWPGLRAKLLKNSTRFVLFIKGTPKQEPTGITHISVSLKLSPDALEGLLRDEGVLGSGAVKVLPLVEVIDPRGTRYLWWIQTGDEASLAQELFKKFYLRLSAKFKTKNVYVLDPTASSFRMGIPANYRLPNMNRDEQMMFAQYLKADVVLSGKIYTSNPAQGNSADMKLYYDLQLWQAKSGRGISEVQRTESIASDAPKHVHAALEQYDSKVLDILGTRLAEALNAGSLNLNLVRLEVSGTMTYRQMAEFKRLLSQMREIKVLKERLFEPSKVIFEAETQVSGEELGKIVQKGKFPLYTVTVDRAQANSLALNVRALSSASAQ